MTKKGDDSTYARAYTMSRLAVVVMQARAIIEMGDEAIALFVDPDDDKKGKRREELFGAVDEAAGDLAQAIQSAQESLGDCDMREGDDDDDDDDDEGDDDGE